MASGSVLNKVRKSKTNIESLQLMRVIVNHNISTTALERTILSLLLLGGGRSQTMVLGNFQCQSILVIWSIVGQRPTASACNRCWGRWGGGGVGRCLDNFHPNQFIRFFAEAARPPYM